MTSASTPMNIPLVDLKAQMAAIGLELYEAFNRVSGHCGFIMGKEVADFEAAFARFTNAQRCVGVASGTAALHLSLRALVIGPGDEVIVPAHTFMATAEAVLMVGAKPVFVDIDPVSYCISPELAEQAITDKTRAIIPVHLYGHPANMTVISRIAAEHGLSVIEDAAQAHGAELDGQRCGTMGDLGCFSFFPGKNLGALGDAGGVTGNTPILLDRVARLRNHGRSSKYEHEEIGFGERMDALQAALLSTKLQYLETWTEQRRRAASLYNELLADTGLTLPVEKPGARHVYHLYVVRTDKRDGLLEYLKENGVGAGIHYPVPLHRQPVCRAHGLDAIELPETERAAGEVLSLPIYPEITDRQIEYVSHIVKKGLLA